MAKNPKRPRDPNQLAKMITDLATGETSDIDQPSSKDPAAVSMGSRGGKARANSLTPEQRKAIAKKAAKKRWES